jgi:hypothetical protein
MKPRNGKLFYTRDNLREQAWNLYSKNPNITMIRLAKRTNIHYTLFRKLITEKLTMLKNEKCKE